MRAWDQNGRYGLYLVNARSGDVSPLKSVPGVDETLLSMGRWSRNGRTVVFLFDRRLMRVEPGTGEERVLHTFPPGPIRFADVSPLDDSILFVQVDRSSDTTL